MSNIPVTHNNSLNNARSESNVAVNPKNPLQLVSGSKKFNNVQTYDFVLATQYSTDGGLSWHDSAAFALPGFTLLTDPALAWDDSGNVFLVGLSGNNPPTFNTIGIEIYKSTDGGQTWSSPQRIHSSAGDDKQWAAGDGNSGSPFQGRVYAVWDDGSNMCFARTKDHGATWVGTGVGATAAGTVLVNDSFSPEINVAANGDIYIVWVAANQIKLIVSNDGGDSFHAVASPATGITTLSVLPAPNGFPNFPGGKFRVLTLPTACVFGQTVIAAWADFREGVSRIYYARSINGGTSWTTGPSGQPLLTGALPASFQHFHPQIVSDPNGVIGCAFYEFGPKPTTPLIDVIMSQSFDGGATFNHFTVTDQAWDPTIDAPWSHGNPNMTFIGDYFGLDASSKGFYPVWTDTRTGIQELWTAIVPEKKCAFIINRSTLGQDEVDALRGLPGGAVIPDAFRVIVDGFTATELGATGISASLPVASPVAGMTIIPRGNMSGTLSYGPDVQRFTFFYDIDFGAADTAFAFVGPTKFLTLQVSAGATSAQAQIELIKQPNPFLLHGDVSWLSIDLRVFVVRAGEAKFGVPGISDATDAPRFIQQLMASITPTQFETLSPVEAQSKLYVQPRDENNALVFNFSLAKVHYIGLIGAANVRVFFRLFQAQTTSGAFDFPPGAQYRRALTNPHGQPIALAGIQGSEYVTIPCFSEARVDSTVVKMDQQNDDHNVKTITAHVNGSEVDTFFGCWIDINQPFQPDGVTPNNRLPVLVPPLQDGPFNPVDPNPNFRPLTIQQAILRNLHQCLMAEIAFDPVTIPIGKDPSNWDKLAQRNIAWSDIGSAQAVSTFEIQPTSVKLPAGLPPDELMIDWGNTPKGSVASIYLPAVSVDTILAMAGRLYTSHRLQRLDDHTLQCATGGITYIPIPAGAQVNYAGLLTVQTPATVKRGQVFHIIVRQVTNAARGGKSSGQVAAGRNVEGAASAAATGSTAQFYWRRVLGAFQLTIPVKTKALLLVNEERDLSVLRWIGETIPHQSRWYQVFRRYLHAIGGRVTVFGGDPGQVVPSPTGDGKHKPHPHPGSHGEGHGHEQRIPNTGKIAGLMFDHFGDFEGFILETQEHERKFFSREKDVADLAERAWRERLLITVWVERDDPNRPLTLIVRQPPVSFKT
jgi:hypothetical protein